jgi:hypothetical protein
MANHNFSSLKLWFIMPVIALMFGCNNKQKQLSGEQVDSVKNKVNTFALNIATDISAKGPAAWLNYFENSQDFFMASDGQIVFHNYLSAQKFIQDTLVKNISSIKLHWANMRINVLSPRAAAIGSDFHEDITMAAANNVVPIDGYFTGTAVLDGNNWKLRNLHWSIKKH